jgi:hypothetical protein
VFNLYHMIFDLMYQLFSWNDEWTW